MPEDKGNQSLQIPSSEPEQLSLGDSNQPPVETPPSGVDETENFLGMVRSANAKKVDGDSTDETPDKKEDSKKPDSPSEPKPESDESDEDKKKDSENFVDPLTEDKERKSKKKSTTAENMKNLRTALQSEKEKSSLVEKELNELKAKIEQTGGIDDLQREVQEREERIKQLEPYEQMLGLYQTPGFKEQYYDQVDGLVAQAKKIAGDYEVSEDVIDQAVRITNRKELNQLLGSYFDQYGVGEVRQAILEAQGIVSERQKLEKNPVQARNEIIEFMKNNQKKEHEAAQKALTSSMKDAWGSILTLYSQGDNAIELLREVPGNEEHNQLRSSMLSRSSEEFGKVVGVLASHGLKRMPEAVAKALAARFQLGEVAAHAINRNRGLEAKVTELQSELGRVNGYTRPSGRSGKVDKSAPTEPQTMDDIAAHTFSKARDSVEAHQ